MKSRNDPGHSAPSLDSAVRVALGVALALVSSNALAQEWMSGQIVIASPMQGEMQWLRCQVLSGPNEYGNYEVNCLDSHLDTYSKKVRYESRVQVPAKWIKPDDPSFKPDMQFAAVRPAAVVPAARPSPPPAPATVGGPAKPGAYSCFMWIGPVQTGYLSRVPGFTLTAAGYRHQNGGGGTTRRVGDVIEFKGGPLNGQAGKVAPGKVHLFNKQRSWTVMDCTR